MSGHKPRLMIDRYHVASGAFGHQRTWMNDASCSHGRSRLPTR
jgi:hypothetical protein